MFSPTPTDLIAIKLSLQAAVTATIIALPADFAVAYLLAMSEIRGNTVIEGIVKLPLVLPPVVTGHLLILLFGRNGWLGQLFQLLDIKFTFTLQGEEDL